MINRKPMFNCIHVYTRTGNKNIRRYSIDQQDGLVDAKSIALLRAQVREKYPTETILLGIDCVEM